MKRVVRVDFDQQQVTGGAHRMDYQSLSAITAAHRTQC